MKKLCLLVAGVLLLAAPMVYADITEGFEGAFPPAGWEMIDNGGIVTALLSTAYANTGLNSVIINSASDQVISPLVANPQAISFYLRATGLTDFNVMVSTDNKVNWTLVQKVAVDPAILNPTTLWVQATVDLSSVDNVYIRLTRSGTRTYYIDDVVITEGGTTPPPPPPPTGSGADKTGSIALTASIGAITSMTVADQSGDGQISFGTLTQTYQKAPEYIAINASSNYGTWAIEIYTNNFPSAAPSTSVWGYAYGGLIDVANGKKIPLGWCAFDSESPSEPTGLPGDANRWTYVKDKRDMDDPSTAGNDESWNAREGYANVAFGGPGYAKVVNPYVAGGDDMTMPFCVYLETAGTAVTGNYTGTIYFDLYHE